MLYIIQFIHKSSVNRSVALSLCSMGSFSPLCYKYGYLYRPRDTHAHTHTHPHTQAHQSKPYKSISAHSIVRYKHIYCIALEATKHVLQRIH